MKGDVSNKIGENAAADSSRPMTEVECESSILSYGPETGLLPQKLKNGCAVNNPFFCCTGCAEITTLVLRRDKQPVSN
jgi:hypothetical protein